MSHKNALHSHIMNATTTVATATTTSTAALLAAPTFSVNVLPAGRGKRFSGNPKVTRSLDPSSSTRQPLHHGGKTELPVTFLLSLRYSSLSCAFCASNTIISPFSLLPCCRNSWEALREGRRAGFLRPVQQRVSAILISLP